MLRLILIACALLLTFSRACTEVPAAHRTSGDLAIQVRDIFLRYCVKCHSGGKEPGTSKLKVLDHKQMTAKRPVPLVAQNRAQVLELVKDGSMPPANRPGPNAAEIAILEKWVKAGAPAYPEAFDDQFTLEAIADDLDREIAKAKNRNASENLRYVSFAHLIRDGEPSPNLADYEQRLNAALSLAVGSPVQLQAVDVTATLFRIDLAKLGWRRRELFEKVERRKPAGVVGLQPFDLILLEYPHAEAVSSPRLTDFLSAKNQVKPMPFVRGDWLTTTLVTGDKLTPLAEDLRSLAALENAMARAQPAPDGPALPRQLGTAKPFVAPRLPAGRALIPPLSAWYGSDVTPEPAPFTLTAELVSDGQAVKGVKVDERFKLKVHSDRRVYLTLIMVQADGEVQIQEVDGGSVLQPNTPRELSPGPDGFAISGIVSGGSTATEYFILFSAETELPRPTIVRSLHADRPIYRFLLDLSAIPLSDPQKVVRKIIPIPVTKK